MLKSQARNCWEFWDCPDESKLSCPAFLNDFGRECWLIASTFIGETSPKAKNRYENCFECAWYKKVQLEASRTGRDSEIQKD